MNQFTESLHNPKFVTAIICIGTGVFIYMNQFLTLDEVAISIGLLFASLSIIIGFINFFDYHSSSLKTIE